MRGAQGLDKNAIDAFIGQIWLMNEVGLTPPHVLAEQIVTLCDLADSTITRLPMIDEYLDGPFWQARPFIGLASRQRPDDEEAQRGWDGEGSALVEEDPHAQPGVGILALITNVHLPLRERWEFHLHDADPFPSIPHGHLHSSARRPEKLDPYRNRIVATGAGTPKYTSEKRDGLRALWNDSRFRELAHESLRFHLSTNEDRFRRIMTARGVQHPMRLPR